MLIKPYTKTTPRLSKVVCVTILTRHPVHTHTFQRLDTDWILGFVFDEKLPQGVCSWMHYSKIITFKDWLDILLCESIVWYADCGFIFLLDILVLCRCITLVVIDFALDTTVNLIKNIGWKAHPFEGVVQIIQLKIQMRVVSQPVSPEHEGEN